MGMIEKKPSRIFSAMSLERKIWLGKWALFFEDLWPRLWLPIAAGALFVLVSLLGVWPLLGDTWHMIALALFALAAAAGLVHAGRARWPSRPAATRRVERDSGLAHRPASSYEDTLPAETSDPATAALWAAHRAWLLRLLGRLRVGKPRPGVHRRDPLALRLLLMLLVLVFAAAAGDGALDRLRAAFRFDGAAVAASARLDAWVTPPAYTGKPPIMLADGSRPGKPVAAPGGGTGAFEVPERSVLIARSSGQPSAGLSLTITEDGRAPRRIDGKPAGAAGDVSEVKFEITSSARVEARTPGSRRADWRFSVIPDLPPKITLTKAPERTARGALKLTYTIEDDHGVSGAEVKFAKVERPEADPAKAWARPEAFQGPRFTLERPPRLPLRLPPSKAKDAAAETYLEIGSHPWAGVEAAMTLEAKDVAGKVGRSQPLVLKLPERRFEKPLARAIVEQRRKLVLDSRARDRVLTALAALTLEPDGFIEDSRAYLGLRSAYHRLRQDESRAGFYSAVEQLWHVALRIEDGDLSEAERNLREAQDKLSKALEDGASDDEIKELMAELRQALDQYMRQMAKQAEDMRETPQGLDPNTQALDRQDLDRMMKNIEEMAKNGSREQAQQMLSQLRDIMERMQTGKMSEKDAQKTQEMVKMLNELGGLVDKQRQLMDDTFAEQKNLDGQGQDQQKGQQKGQKGGEKGPPARGKGARQGQPGQVQGDGGGQGQGGQKGGPGDLGARQSELREQLRELRRGMSENGLGAPDKLDAAQDAMKEAEQALEQEDLAGATDQQARALDEMRQGAQAMAQEMLQKSPGRQGQSMDTQRDPLGRPQRSQGPDLGTSVKVPDQIDMQRAREILEELRRRLGDSSRPAGEIDYLERLLRRF